MSKNNSQKPKKGFIANPALAAFKERQQRRQMNHQMKPSNFKPVMPKFVRQGDR